MSMAKNAWNHQAVHLQHMQNIAVRCSAHFPNRKSWSQDWLQMSSINFVGVSTKNQAATLGDPPWKTCHETHLYGSQFSLLQGLRFEKDHKESKGWPLKSWRSTLQKLIAFICDMIYGMEYIISDIQCIKEYMIYLSYTVWCNIFDMWYPIYYERYAMIYNNMIWYEIARNDMLWYDMVWHDMARHYMKWYDMIWNWKIWHDMIWYDIILYHIMLYYTISYYIISYVLL